MRRRPAHFEAGTSAAHEPREPVSNRTSRRVRLEVLPERKTLFPKLNRFDPKERVEHVMLVYLAKRVEDSRKADHLRTRHWWDERSRESPVYFDAHKCRLVSSLVPPPCIYDGGNHRRVRGNQTAVCRCDSRCSATSSVIFHAGSASNSSASTCGMIRISWRLTWS